MSKIKVTNRKNAIVGYTIPDMNNLRREFQPGETKTLDDEEMFKLSQIPGGKYILNNSLIIEDAAVVQDIVGNVEPEYFYKEEDVKKIMLEGTIDEFDDMITFSPKGNVELIKQLAVALPLNDVAKRKIIFEKTGFSVENALKLMEGEEKEEVVKPQRKAAPPTATKVVRKVAAPTVPASK